MTTVFNDAGEGSAKASWVLMRRTRADTFRSANRRKNLHRFSMLHVAEPKNRTSIGPHPGRKKNQRFQSWKPAMSGALNLSSDFQHFLRLRCGWCVGQPSNSVAEYGRTACPIKAVLRPPPSVADGLDRARRPAVVCHQEFDGAVWLMPTRTLLPLSYFARVVIAIHTVD